MIKVKISTAHPDVPIIQITPGSKGIIGNYQFFINQNIPEADWWVIIDGLSKKESVRCPKENTVLITLETEVVKKYRQDYVDQFNWVVTSQQTLKHPRQIFTHQGHQSYLFMKSIKPGQSLESYHKQFRSYDELRAMTPANIPKSKIMTAVVSHKLRTEGAVARHNFITKIKEHFGERFDVYCNKPEVFGPETKVAGYKWDAVAPYKYVISIENSYAPHWWTNHLFDAFLAGAYPIFYGHPSVFKYFPKNSLTLVDINDIPTGIATIEKVISEKYHEKYRDEIWAARKLVLDKYNQFQTIVNIISKLPEGGEKQSVTIEPERDPLLARKQKCIRVIEKIPIARNVGRLAYRAYRQLRYGVKRK